jgi:uncharacterized protein
MRSLEHVLDPLYGECQYAPEIAALIKTPIVQRLRDIRLSNIDSTAMPGIANISRFEHSLGASHLASRLRIKSRPNESTSIVLQAAALLHDSAIPPFGHIIEEAWHYVGAPIDHERRWNAILSGEAKQIGGINLQIYLGRQAKLQEWATTHFGTKSNSILKSILEAILGKGYFGKCIAGDLDVDNLDNVTRAAFHMGLAVDKMLPSRIASSVIDIHSTGVLVYSDECLDDISSWITLRRELYELFMLTRADFAGKIMLIHAAIIALQEEVFTQDNWNCTDREFITKLLSSSKVDLKETIARWLSGELWTLSDLHWGNGPTPSYKDIFTFSKELKRILKRECLAYRIKDKRYRAVNIVMSSGKQITLGHDSTSWLIGVGSPSRASFTKEDNRKIADFGRTFFKSALTLSEHATGVEANPSLL